MDPEFDSRIDVEKERGKKIFDAKPSVTIATTKIQPEELEEPEEWEHLLHSQLWVQSTPLHFIVDNGN